MLAALDSITGRGREYALPPAIGNCGALNARRLEMEKIATVKVQIITQCTGEKAVSLPDQLTAADFEAGPEVVAYKQARLQEFLRPAKAMYTGQQHSLLMQGVAEAQAFAAAHDIPWDARIWIVSAGYGLIPGHQPIAPYNCTFQGMGKKQIAEWAEKLGIPTKVRTVLREPFDFGLILLGADYLRACRLDDDVTLGGPTLLFAAENAQKAAPDLPNLRMVTIRPSDTTRFSRGHIALKGELGARALRFLSRNPNAIATLMRAGSDVLHELATLK